MKKVVFLISHIPNPRILKRIKTIEHNFEVDLIYWDRGIEIKESFTINPTHKVHRLKIKAPLGKPLKRILPYIKFRKETIELLGNMKPDIIHAANLDMLAIATKYKKKYNKEVKIIYEVADLPKYSFASSNILKEQVFILIRKYETLQTKEISKIFLTSPYFWEEYYSKMIPQEKYLFIPNTPYKSLFQSYGGKNKDRPFTIGFIGSVRYVEQLIMLIDAVENLNEEDIRILIAGSGPGLEEIRSYSKDKRFVELYGPYNYENEIVFLYEQIDMVYSVYDNKLENVKIALPNRLYESIACSLPIIVSSDTQLSNFVEELGIGLAIKNKQDLIFKLNHFFENPEIYEKIVLNLEKNSNKFFFEQIEKEISIAYESIT